MTLIRCLDTETTGLDPRLDRIVEIATVDIEIHRPEEYGQPSDKLPTITRGRMWSSLVQPGRSVPPEASAVHDITDEMLVGKPAIGDVIGYVKYTEDIGPGEPDYICAHYNRFDMQFINLHGWKWLDTWRIAVWLWPDAPNHKNATLRYWLKLNLDPTVTSMGVDGSTRNHRALWDAYVTASILRRMLQEGASIEDMLRVSSQPAVLPRLGFGEHALKPLREVPSGYLQWILDKFEREKEDERHTAMTELQRRRREGL